MGVYRSQYNPPASASTGGYDFRHDYRADDYGGWRDERRAAPTGTVYGGGSRNDSWDRYHDPDHDRAPGRGAYTDDVDWDTEFRRDIRTRDDYADYYDDDYYRNLRRQKTDGGFQAGVRGLGELLITFGLVVLLFAGYEVWGKSAQVDAAQGELDRKLEDVWGGSQDRRPRDEPLPGDAIARLYIPRLDKRWVVVEGVAPADIKNAPGHYPDSAMPGKIGNFSVAGHRMPAVFWNLHKMKNGDPIYLEDRKNWYEYEVTEVKIVTPNAVEVVAPVPGQPGKKPTVEMLTITTCNPQWDNYERLIVHAKLTSKKPKSEGRPAGLPDKG